MYIYLFFVIEGLESKKEWVSGLDFEAFSRSWFLLSFLIKRGWHKLIKSVFDF